MSGLICGVCGTRFPYGDDHVSDCSGEDHSPLLTDGGDCVICEACGFRYQEDEAGCPNCDSNSTWGEPRVE